MTRRVAVTGMGVVSALGHSLGEFTAALAAGRSGIRAISLIDPSLLRYLHGAEVPAFDPTPHFDPKTLDLMDRFAQFAVVAARQASADSGLQWTTETQRRTAVVTGSCVGGQTTEDASFLGMYRDKRDRVNPFTIPRVMANAGASWISQDLGLRGPVLTMSTACASANHAIGQAYWMVRNGVAESAIAGGSEAPFSLGNVRAWESMRVVANDTCRPFCKDRKGLILGEGAAMLVLEPMDAARARGARIYGEMIGFGMSADAHHITLPSVEGPAAAMRAALEDAALEPARIGYINAHGTGTAANDVTETRAIRDVFGAHAAGLAVSSTKSMHGHALGAAGALEAVATLAALDSGLLPPTANFTTPDPDCDLDYVPNQSRPAQVEYAISNAFAFGGLNAVLVFRRTI